ncbi:MAG TPA: hypothetical protein VH165_07370 [Kofleriaceae bacterium]|nr:hypothetical protein [Kofleriaceae bacterium]
MTRPALAALCLIACARATPAPSAARTAAQLRGRDQVTLYRDRALVAHQVDVIAPAAGRLTLAVRIAAGVEPDDVLVLDPGGLTVDGLRIASAARVEDRPPRAPDTEPAEDPVGPDDLVRDADSDPAGDTAGDTAGDPADAPAGEPTGGTIGALPAPPAPNAPGTPTELEITVDAPRAGHFTLALGYATDRLAWDAAYTMTTGPARDRVTLRGALAIRNTAGLALRARVTMIDAPLGAWRDHAAARLGSALAGAPPPPATTQPRELGDLELGAGETRVELLPGDPPRKLRKVVVYDPIGTRLDHPGAAPASDPALGTGPAPTRLTESFELERDARATRGLPAGPVRLVERRPDGSLGVLGESRLYDAATRVAGVDTIPIGAADGLTGHRERRDWAKDGDHKRLSEELLLTIDNARPRPVDVVIREHLYRGQNWTLAYQSAPAAKEGPQQIALRTTVPANGQAKVLYVVVYTW